MLSVNRWLRRILPYLIGILVLCLFIFHSVRGLEFPLVEHLRRGYYDFRLQLTVPNRRDDRIVIVDIDEKSLAELGHWPWPRNRLASLVHILFEHYQIRLLGFDMLFAERDDRSGWDLLERLAHKELQYDQHFIRALDALRPSLQYDEVFAQAMRGRPVVLGFATRNKDGASNAGILPEPLLQGEAVPPLLLKNLQSFSGFTGNLPILQDAAAGGGFIVNPFLDADGVFRRVPLLVRYQDAVYESLSLSMFRALEGFPPVELEIGEEYGNSADEQRLEALRVGQRRIPTGDQAEVLIPYYGKMKAFRYLSIIDVMRQRADPEALRGRIVLVGTTASGLMDSRTTPLQINFPGVEIHANVLAGMLDGTFKEQPSWVEGLEIVQLLAVGLTMIFLPPLLSALGSTGLAIGLLAALLAGNFWLWNQAQVSVDAVLPVILTFFLYATHMFFGFFMESYRKRKLTGWFGQYVPEYLVHEMSRLEENFSIVGETREMTVLFSDVRGFTTISEGLSPRELSQLMNDFLTPLTATIHAHHGTIDKYMGDAIMAFWGAPLQDRQHALHGVQAALEMVLRVEEIQKLFKERGWPKIRIGIGINTGTMNVGNMGSQFRMAYTVLGDAVNLGSRLESLTKQYGVKILISETTRQSAQEVVCRIIDRVRVKGKHEPVTVYEPLGSPKDITPAAWSALQRHEEAFNLYQAQRWNEAESLFAALSKDDPKRQIYRIYLNRISHYRDNPPGAAWDGVYTYSYH